jgi:hypothetical protein
MTKKMKDAKADLSAEIINIITVIAGPAGFQEIKAI